MTAQLEFGFAVDDDTARLLDLIAGNSDHEKDREAIVRAIRASVRPDGTVCGNDWRPRIPRWVDPRVVGATVHALSRAGVLVATGSWAVSDDTCGRNSGKPTRIYRWENR